MSAKPAYDLGTLRVPWKMELGAIIQGIVLLMVDLTVRTPKLLQYLTQILHLDCREMIKKHSTKTVPIWKGISKVDFTARIPKLWPLAPSSIFQGTRRVPKPQGFTEPSNVRLRLWTPSIFYLEMLVFLKKYILTYWIQ